MQAHHKGKIVLHEWIQYCCYAADLFQIYSHVQPSDFLTNIIMSVVESESKNLTRHNEKNLHSHVYRVLIFI